MKNAVNWFEIPVSNYNRAKQFYSAVFGLDIQDYAGLGKKYPALAAAMLVFMLSFTGIPPTLGFAGKFFLFRTVLEGGFVGLAVLGMLTSLVSAYYYLRIIIIMYMQSGNPRIIKEPSLNAIIAVSAVGTVLLFFASEPLFNWAAQAVLTF